MRALDATLHDAADVPLLAREVMAALAGDDELAVVAAAVAGHLHRSGDAIDQELADALAAILDRSAASERLRHSAVLGLVHVHPPRKQPSPAIKLLLEREAKLDTEAGRLAAWMLAW